MTIALIVSLVGNAVQAAFLFQAINQRHEIDQENAALSWAALRTYTKEK